VRALRRTAKVIASIEEPELIERLFFRPVNSLSAALLSAVETKSSAAQK
jgi:hypothetical protein